MKAKEFIEQEKELMQVVPTPFAAEAVKSEFMRKQAEFEYTGILVDNVEFTSEGSVLTLSQDGKTATAIFSYAEDVGPFVSVKSGQGESVNLDLTPLSPPVIQTSIGKMINVSDMSWMTVEAFEGILSAANLKPVEIDPNAPPDSMGSQGSGASTPTSELPQQQTAELDAKQVPAPTPRSGIPGESLYSDGKSRYYPGIKVSAIDEIGKKHEQEGINEVLDTMDKQELAKGKNFKIILPSGMGEPLYTNSFLAAKEMAKEYGKGTRVIDLSNEESLKEQDQEDDNDEDKHWDEGRWVTVKPTGSGLRKSNPAANWITKEQKVKLLEPAVEGTLDVFDVETESGEEESIYGFNIVGSAPGLESMYTDGTSKYYPGLKQEAIHRVTWSKGKDIFITDVEAGSEKEASKKVKDSVRADKIVSVGKQVKEDKSKELTLFRFAIREGQRIKIPVGKVSIKEDVHDDKLPPGYEIKPVGARSKDVSLYGTDGKWVGQFSNKKAAIRKAWLVQRVKDKAAHEDYGAYSDGEEEKLMSENPKNGTKALIAFFKKFPDKKRKGYNYTFEDGHLWITGIEGDQYDVVDAEGPGAVDGFDFEQVSFGAEENLKTKKATEFLKRFGK